MSINVKRGTVVGAKVSHRTLNAGPQLWVIILLQYHKIWRSKQEN
jgi:hypothetical protein